MPSETMRETGIASSGVGGLPGREGWRAGLSRILGHALVFVYVLVAAEAYLRLFAPQPILPRHVIDSGFGIRTNSPSDHYWQRTPDVQVEIRTNSKGIRADREIPYHKPEGVKRIVLLGDSFGMGYEVELKDTFLQRLEDALRVAGEPVETINLSVSGHGNAEELLMLRHEGLRYEPDLVLVAWHISDLDDNTRSNLFALRDDRLVQVNEVYLPGVKTRVWLERFAAYRWAEANSHLYTFVREDVAGNVKTFLTWLRRSKGPTRAPPGEAAAAPAEDEQVSYSDRLTLALLREMKRESEQAGARFLIVELPTRISRTEFASSLPHLGPRDGGLDVVSVKPAFDRHRGELLYWERGHFHFTPLGCRLVGDEVAEQILREGLLRSISEKPAKVDIRRPES